MRKVIACSRISTARDRLSAALMLMTIRLYRAWRMSAALLPNSDRAIRHWNRT
jgi:hypothetical protein